MAVHCCLSSWQCRDNSTAVRDLRRSPSTGHASLRKVQAAAAGISEVHRISVQIIWVADNLVAFLIPEPHPWYFHSINIQYLHQMIR